MATLSAPFLGNNAAPPAIRPAARNRFLSQRSARFGILLGPALLLLYWTVLSLNGWLDPRTLPAPWTAVEAAVDLIRDGRLQSNLAVSAGRAFAGLALGSIVAVALALISGLTVLGDYVIDGLAQMKRGIPILALIPFMMLWLPSRGRQDSSILYWVSQIGLLQTGSSWAAWFAKQTLYLERR